MKTEEKKLEDLLRHIENVQENCIILGKKLIEQGKPDFGRVLIANGMIHDNSKFTGIEWVYLDPEAANRFGLKNAITAHRAHNPHHPEHWQGIHNMPDIYVAEMVCDWKARSTEFANDLRDWIHNTAVKQFSFKMTEPVGQLIEVYVDMLCDKPFGRIEDELKQESQATTAGTSKEESPVKGQEASVLG